MTNLYLTRVAATGGRNGTIRSEDGLLDLQLAFPRELGGAGGATNPEQLFAGGYAACFGNALLRVARQKGCPLSDSDVQVVVEVGLSRTEADAFLLHVTMTVIVATLDASTAERLVQDADNICPYSNAIRGNVEVVRSVKASRQ